MVSVQGLIRNVEAANGTVNYVHLHEMLFNPYALYLARGATAAVSSALHTPVHSVDPHVTTEVARCTTPLQHCTTAPLQRYTITPLCHITTPLRRYTT